MKADELTAEVRVLHERTNKLDERLQELKDSQEALRRQIEELKNALTDVRRQLTDHIAHVEKWDARRWAVVGAILGGLAINVVMLFINRK